MEKTEQDVVDSMKTSWVLLPSNDEVSSKTELEGSDADSDSISVISESSNGHDFTDEENAHGSEPDKKVNTALSSELKAETEEKSSVIDDTETLSESIENNKDNETDQIETLGGTITEAKQAKEATSFSLKSLNRYLYLSFPLLFATVSFLLANYYSLDAENFDEDIPGYYNLKNYDFYNNFETEPLDPLTYCKQKHKNDDLFMEYNTKKCLKKMRRKIKEELQRVKNRRARGEVDENSRQEEEDLMITLKKKERYLKEKEEYLMNREYELMQRKKMEENGFTQSEKQNRIEKEKQFKKPKKIKKKLNEKEVKREKVEIKTKPKKVKEKIENPDFKEKIERKRTMKKKNGNWYFERASSRNLFRDNAFWYFNWMTDRQNQRVKKVRYM